MSSNDTYLNIDTPENVTFNYEIAGLGSRFIAALMDSLIIGLSVLLLYAIVMGIIALSSMTADDIATMWFFAGLTLASFLVLWGYYVLFETLWNGQTPGKRLAKMQVVRLDGTPISFTESAIRNVVRLVDFLPLGYGIGAIVMFFDPQSRRLGDMAAGTLVVLNQPTEPVAEGYRRRPLVQNKFAQTALESGLPVERLSDTEVQLIQEFLSRRFAFADTHSIAQSLVAKAFQSMEIPLERLGEHSPEEWLQIIYLSRIDN